jgi:hypothetical protein
MALTKKERIELLNKKYKMDVDIYPGAPLSPKNSYDVIRNLPGTGFNFRLKELLHAIGSKTAALPKYQIDEALRSAHLYLNILDLESDTLAYRVNIDPDLQIARSQEIGIGFTCLLANRYFKIPWSRLESIPGNQTRFDYRGQNNGTNCIFEAKGTKNIGNQTTQLKNGLKKKKHFHKKNQFHDVELIISSFVGDQGTTPRLLIGDPDYIVPEYTFSDEARFFYQLRHYSRIFQFAGMSREAYYLYKYSQNYYKYGNVEGIFWGYPPFFDREIQEYNFMNQRFWGTWSDSWLPKESNRYKNLNKYDYSSDSKYNFRIFQGIRSDVTELLLLKPTGIRELVNLENEDIAENTDVSIFSDGSIQVISD